MFDTSTQLISVRLRIALLTDHAHSLARASIAASSQPGQSHIGCIHRMDESVGLVTFRGYDGFDYPKNLSPTIYGRHSNVTHFASNFKVTILGF